MTTPTPPLTRVRRHPERGVYDRPTIDAILDEALFCHLAYVAGGVPRVIPTIHARVDDTLYLHGSAASRTLRAVPGTLVAVAVTLLDGLVLARSAFNHSMNYRSVIVYGTARLVSDPEEKGVAQCALVEHVVPGRSSDARMPDERELEQTAIVAVPIEQASAKIRTGPPKDDEDDHALDVWAGVLPLELVASAPEPDPRLRPGIPSPPYLADAAQRRRGRPSHSDDAARGG